MAYQQTAGERLANRLGAYQQAQQAAVAQRMNAQRALGPILATPQATGPQYSVAQMLANSSNAPPIATPGLNPAPEPAAPQVDPMAQVAQIAQALNPSAMPATAGSAPATGDASAPSAEGFAPMIDAVKQFFTGNAPSMTGVPPQATSADAATAAAVLGNPAAAGATIGENIPQAPFTGVAEGQSPEAAQAAAAALGKPQDTMSSIGEWLTGLFSGGDTPAAPARAPAPNTPPPAGAAPAIGPAVSAPAPTQGGLAELVKPSPREGIAPIATQAYKGIPFITDPETGRTIQPGQAAPAAQQSALETAKAEQQALRSERATAAGNAVSTALTAALPDLPKAEASAVKSVFENEDLYKMMIAAGSALDSGLSYGEAMLAGSQAFLGSQAARKKLAEDEASKAAAAAQQKFENEIEVAKLGKGKLKEQAEIKLAEARTRAVEAGIPLNDERLKLIQAQTQNAQAQAARANRDKSGGSGGSGGDGKGISKKDYTKFVLDEKNRIEMNGEEVPEGLTGDQWARIRVNVAAGPDQAQYITPSTDVKEKVLSLAKKAKTKGLTVDEKRELGWYQNLYGDEY